jgi:hypothetical protein
MISKKEKQNYKNKNKKKHKKMEQHNTTQLVCWCQES